MEPLEKTRAEMTAALDVVHAYHITAMRAARYLRYRGRAETSPREMGRAVLRADRATAQLAVAVHQLQKAQRAHVTALREARPELFAEDASRPYRWTPRPLSELTPTPSESTPPPCEYPHPLREGGG